MTKIPTPPPGFQKSAVPMLHNGDRLKQPEFHRRYEAYPGPEKFELIGGTVYMASPTRYAHGRYHKALGGVFDRYELATPGVEAALEISDILGEGSEPQPDLSLRIIAECGGRSRINDDGYLEGPPELLAEIAYSSVSIDLNQKREDYQRAGVQEYLVVCIEEQELRWFDFAAGEEVGANRQGVFRSRVFPGLWIHGAALLALDSNPLLEILQEGLASRAHAPFVRRLERARRRGAPGE
jgi:Uma2 family endonuclease